MISQNSQQKIDLLGSKDGNPDLLSNVVSSIESGEAIVFEHEAIGCVIAKPVFRDSKIGMLIWVGVSNCGNGISKCSPFFHNMAKNIGMNFIEFRTKRTGFKRLAKKLNFEESDPVDGFLVFIKEVI